MDFLAKRGKNKLSHPFRCLQNCPVHLLQVHKKALERSLLYWNNFKAVLRDCKFSNCAARIRSTDRADPTWTFLLRSWVGSLATKPWGLTVSSRIVYWATLKKDPCRKPLPVRLNSSVNYCIYGLHENYTLYPASIQIPFWYGAKF